MWSCSCRLWQILYQLPLLIILIQSCIPQTQAFKMSSTSFSLPAEIEYQREKYTNSYVDVEEFYSFQEKRAKIKLTLSESNFHLCSKVSRRYTWVTIYKDEYGLVSNDHNNNECKPIVQQSVDTYLRLPWQIKYNDTGPENWIIGTARILSFSEKMTKFKQYDQSNSDAFFVAYKYTLAGQHVGSLEVIERYSILEIESKNNQYPNEMIFIDAHEQSKTIIKFGLLMPILNGDDLDQDASEETLSWDLTTRSAFSLPPMKCSPTLGENRRVDLMRLMHPDSTEYLKVIRYSFKTRITIDQSIGINKREVQDWSSNVVYDEKSGAMLIEYQRHLVAHEHDETIKLRQVIIDNNIVSYYSSAARKNRFVYHRDERIVDSLSDLQKVLLGHEGKFIKLGQTYVRGVRADIYEATKTSAPIWLARPIKIKHNSDQMNVNPYWRELDNLPANQLTTLVYVSHLEKPDSRVSGDSLEVLAMQIINPRLNLHISIDIYDFTWNPAKERASITIQPLDESPRALQVELLIASEVGQKPWFPPESFEARPQRDRAIQDALIKTIDHVEFNPIGFLNFETKLPAGYNRDHSTRTRFMASFETLDLRDARSLQVISYGKIPLHPHATETQILDVIDFSLCLSMAINQAESSTQIQQSIMYYFAYEPVEGLCFLLDNEINWNQNIDDEKGTLELYAVFQLYNNNHLLPVLDSDPFSLIGKTFKVMEYESHSFVIEDAKIRVLSEGASDKDGGEFERSNYLGFGFSDEMPQLIKRVNAYDYTHAPNMTRSRPMQSLDDCKAVCLADDQCESFSYCPRPGDVKCFISKLDFKRSGIVDELAKEAANCTKTPLAPFEIQVDFLDRKVKVKFERHPSCEFHSSVHLELFQELEKPNFFMGLTASLASHQGPGSCAKICLNRNIKLIKGSSDGENFKKNETRKERHLGLLAKFCSNFLYLPVPQEFAPAKLKNSNDTSSLCLFKQADLLDSKEIVKLEEFIPYSDEYPQQQNDLIKKTAREFEFRFEWLYEQVGGVRLLESPLNGSLTRAYRDLTRGLLPDPELLKMLKTIHLMGANFISILASNTNERTSAEHCFMQDNYLAPWPACESFDLIMYPNKYQVNRAGYVFQLNSNTLSELMKNQEARGKLIEYEQQQDRFTPRKRYIHYEPRFALRSLLDAFSTDLDNPDEGTKVWTGFDTLGVILVLLLGQLMGLLIGVKLSQYLIRRRLLANSLRRSSCQSDRRQLRLVAEQAEGGDD